MIRLSNVNVSFKSERQRSLFGLDRQQVLFDLSFEVKKGTCLGILGESGSGKSTTGRVITGMLKPDSGQFFFEGLDVYEKKKNKKVLQENMSVVFQDYTTSSNPRFKIRDVIAEGLVVYQRRKGERLDLKKETEVLLDQVGLDASFMDRYPHQLSGGQLQRVCIARAIACGAKVILLDEAISALDAHTQVQIMDLLLELKELHDLTYIFITHDLTSITYMCDEVLFLYEGRVVEQARVEDIGMVKNDYAQKLLGSIIDFE